MPKRAAARFRGVGGCDLEVVLAIADLGRADADPRADAGDGELTNELLGEERAIPPPCIWTSLDPTNSHSHPGTTSLSRETTFCHGM